MTVSKEFFKRLRPLSKHTQFSTLKINDYKLTTLPEITEAFVNHYQFVFASQTLSPDRQKALEECFVIVPSKGTNDHRALCDTPLTLDDLKQELTIIANEKALGLDCFAYEFYKKCWYFVGSNLWNVYKEAIFIGSLGPILNKGNVKFIPKESDPELITN